MSSSNARRPAARQLQLETLEARHTLAASIIASLSKVGILTIEGTARNDQIVVSQIGNKISVGGVKGTFDALKIKAISINTLEGNDTVKLSGLSTKWNKAITVTNAAGNDVVTNIGGKSNSLSAGSLTRATNGKLSIVAAPTDWFDANIQDAALRSLLKSGFGDKVIDRAEMLQLFQQVATDQVVSAAEFADLNAVANNTSLFTSVEYVGVLTKNAVGAHVANATYQGTTLGNLQANSSSAHLDKLVNKWFLGLDRPRANYGGTTFAYAQANGTLFGNGGPTYTDVRQGMVGDCYFVGALGEVALRSPDAIQNMFINNGDGTFTVRFFNNGKSEYVTVDGKLPVDQYGRMVFANMGSYASSQSNVLWVALAEKAYAQMNESGWLRLGLGGNGVNSYQAIAGGYFSAATSQIANRASTTAMIGGSTFSQFQTAFDAGKLIGFASAGSPLQSTIVGGHQYVAVSYNAVAQTVTMFNPWGVNNGSAYPGLVTLSWSALAGNFSYWDRA